LQIENQLGIGLGQTQQRRRPGRHGRCPLLQQRQILGMELRQKIAPGLRCRQLMPQQQRQRLVLAKLSESLGPLAAGRSDRQPALHHLRCAQAAPALVSVISRSIIAAVPVWRKASINPGTPASPVDQSRF
jgi:hypothetical protein